MRKANNKIMVVSRATIGAYRRELSIEVPICSRCKFRLRAIPILVWIVTVIICILISTQINKDSKISENILGGVFLGGFFGVLIAYFIRKNINPADPGEVGISFNNEEYQKLFDAANNRQNDPAILLNALSEVERNRKICPHCGAKYLESDYSPDISVIKCSACKGILEKL